MVPSRAARLLHRRADALFELGDALLCTPVVPSLPHLSLEPVCRRGWGSVDAALARGCIDTERLRDLLVDSCRAPTRPTRPVFAVDVTTWPRATPSAPLIGATTTTLPPLGRPADHHWLGRPVDRATGLRPGLLDRPGGCPSATPSRRHRPDRCRPDPRPGWPPERRSARAAVRLRRRLRLRPAHPRPGRGAGGGDGAAALGSLLLRRPATTSTWRRRPAAPPWRQVQPRRPDHLAGPDCHPWLPRRPVRHRHRRLLGRVASQAAAPSRLWQRRARPIGPGTIIRVQVERVPPHPAAQGAVAVVGRPRRPGPDLAWRLRPPVRPGAHHPVRQADLGWTTPRLRHPEQADRWTWLVLAGYTQLRLARQVACDQRLPWERPRPSRACRPAGCAAGFRGCCARSARRPPRRNPAGAPQGGPRAVPPGPPRPTRRSRSPPTSPVSSRPRPRRPPDRPQPDHPAADEVSSQPSTPAGLNHKLRAYPSTRRAPRRRGVDNDGGLRGQGNAPASRPASGVQNPCPKSTSHNHPLSQGSATLPRMGHLLGYARVSTTDQQSQLQVDALQHAGCYRVFVETASAPAPTAPPSPRSWTSCALVTPWSSGNSTGSAAPSDTWSTPSPAWPNAASGFGAAGGDRHHHPRRQARLPRLRRLGRVRTRPHPRTHGRRTGRGPRARGRRGGRPSVLAGHKLQVVQEMYRSGQYTVTAIAKTLGVSRASIYRHLTSDNR